MELRPGYKQTDVGVIPEDWDVKPIADISPLQRGFDLPNSHLTTGPYPVVYSNGVLNYHNKAMAKAPGVVTGRSGTIGNVHFIDQDYWPHNTALWVTDFKGNEPKYIYYLFLETGLSRFGTGSGVPTLNRNDVHVFRTQIPPPVEQRTIAAALSDVDDLIAALDKQIAKKRDIKQATMQQLLTGKTRLPGFSGKWGDKVLGALGPFSKGKGIKRDQVQTDGLPCVRYGEIYTHHHDHIRQFYSFISPDVAKTSQRIKKGDLLFTGSGETAEEIGKCVAYMDDQEAYAGGDIIILSSAKGDPKFLGYLMNYSSVIEQKTRMGQGDAVVHISATNLSKVQMTLPDQDEQEAIASVLWNMDAEIMALRTQREKCLWLKQGMMQELLTGRIRLV